MSRRHHGGRPHRPNGHARNPSAPLAAPAESRHRPETFVPGRIEPPPPVEQAPATAEPPIEVAAAPDPAPVEQAVEVASAVLTNGHDRAPAPLQNGTPQRAPNGEQDGRTGPAGCTAPQLRRFIKSRPYVPMHELRRRFGIDGTEDDVTPVDLTSGRIFVGLPAREGGLLGELLRGGEVGFELSLDPRSPIVVGLYPMRPVPRT
jgi:hypothetical protein